MGNGSSSDFALDKPISSNKRSVSTIGKITSFRPSGLDDLKRTTSLRSIPIGHEHGKRDDDYASQFLHNLRLFRARQVMTDVTFKLGDTTIRCHRVVLGALSPILLDIFSKKQHSMSAERVDPDTLAALVEFVYNSEAQFNNESLTKLRDATQKLGISQLSKMFDKLMHKLDAKNSRNDQVTYAYRSGSIPGLLSGLRHLRESGILTDITLRAKDVDFCAHRVVLAAASSELQEMIKKLDEDNNNNNNNESGAKGSLNRLLMIPNISSASLKCLIRYMYGGELSIDRITVIDLLINGQKFGLTFVAQSAGRYIEENCISLSNFVTLKNWTTLYTHSKKLHLGRLRGEIRRFCGIHLAEISKQDYFKELTLEDVIWLMPTSTNRQEMDLFEALTGWLRYSVNTRQRHLSSVMALIKFRKMNTRELVEVQSSDFIIANPELKAKIIAASRRNSSAQANELKSTIICAGGCGKDGLQNQIYYRDERGWHSLTSLPVRRKNFAISVIDSDVFVAGGLGIDSSTLATAHRYNSKEHSWESLPAMSKRRSHFCLLPLNGNLYAIGGMTDQWSSTDTTEVYDIRRQRWRKGSVLPAARSQYGAIVLKRTGEIMVTGGAGSESSVLLLSGDMWIKRNSLPQRVAPNHSLAQVHNSIYLVDTKSPTLLQYHSSVDEWTILKPPPQLGFSLCVSLRNSLFLVGSRDSGSVALLTSLDKPSHPDGAWKAPEPVSVLPRDNFQLAIVNILTTN